VEHITPFLPGDTVAYLRLADGERRFPFRPVAPGLFLIGQSPACDLRLGLPEMPSIHSALQVDLANASIARIAESPELVVNGEVVDHARLNDGDLIEIGDIRLVFFLCRNASAQAIDRPLAPEALTPRQLVDGLEAELQLIASESNGHDRIAELLTAAQKAVDACQFAETLRFADYTSPASSSSVSAPPSTLNADATDLILARLASQELRLDEICHVLEQVVHQQQMIATALQCVVERMDDLRTHSQPGSLRASA
jgi:hypothetical protein